MAKKFETIEEFCKEALHNGEGGSGGGAFIITSAYDETADGIKMDHTWQEIVDATLAGKQCMLVDYDKAYDPPVLKSINTSLDILVTSGGSNLGVIVYDITSSEQNKYLNYYTSSADGYPVYYPD